MLSRVLHRGDRIELIRHSTEDSDSPAGSHYASELIEIRGEHEITITQIHDDVRYILPENGERFDLRFIASDGSYTCKAELTGIYKQDGKYLCDVRTLSDLQKDRRRKYFRIDAVRPLSYRCIGNLSAQRLDEEEENRLYDEEYVPEATQSFLSGVLSNISGGGMKFSSSAPLRWDDLIEVVLLLEDTDPEPVTLKSHVIYTESVANTNMSYEHRAEFVDMQPEIREKIVKFVFMQERKQRNLE